MHTKKIKQVFSVTLICALVVSSAMSVFAVNIEDISKGKSDHVIEKQQEKQQEVETRKDKRLENQSEKRQEILKRKEEVRMRYTDGELESLNENTENMRSSVGNGRVLPFDSIISNRKNIKFDTPPVIKGNRTLVPLRAISEGFKADVDWNNETREVTIIKNEMNIVIKIDSNIILVNGEEMEIDTKAEIMSNRTYVPLRFIAETLGIKVEWDQETETIELKEELEVLNDELQEELDELQEQLEELQKKLDNLSEELESLDNEYQEELEGLKEQEEQLKQQEEELTEKIEELEERIEEIKSDLEEVIDEMEQNTEQVQDQNTESKEIKEIEEAKVEEEYIE